MSDEIKKSNRRQKNDRQLARYHKSLRKRTKGKPSNPQGSGTLWGLIGLILGKSLKYLLILILVLGFALLGLGSGVLTGFISTAKDVEIGDITSSNEKTQILDKDGNLLHKLTGSSSIDREFVPYDQVKDTYISKAFMAIEDERFLTHPGIDPKRIVSAIFSALANRGNPTHGGSTITQQTIKMISGADDISAQRKAQEWYNAYRLEQTRSKEGILELYLNLVPMANNIVGVQAAAKSYFNKDAHDLNLLESAFLAGIPNMPSTLNPLTEYGRRNALRRMRYTLAKMRELDFINEQQYLEALDSELIFDFSRAEENDVSEIRSYFVDYAIEQVINDLVEKLGYSPEMAELAVYSQGLVIETTMDSEVQSKLEAVYSDQDNFVKNPYAIPDSPEVPQSSIVVIENNPEDPGRIRGLVGGYGKKKQNMIFNRATDAQRQPGSSIKPVLVYAPALETGKITDATVFEDKPVFLDPHNPDTPYPLNAYRSYLGYVPLRRALVASINTIAADVFTNVVYPEVALDYLRRTGIDRTDETFPAAALGAFTQGVSTLQMAGAYATLASDGIYAKPSAYTRVLKHDGSVLLDNTHPDQDQVYRKQMCWILGHELTYVASNVGANPPNMPAAGKTGTTDDNIDKWFCGFTPYYTAAVWYGYDNSNGRRFSIPDADLNNAVGLWRASMTAIHENLDYKDFAMPDGIKEISVCGETGLLPNGYCPYIATGYLEEGSASYPSGYCSVHQPPPPTTAPPTSPSSQAGPNQQEPAPENPDSPPPENEEPAPGTPKPAQP